MSAQCIDDFKGSLYTMQEVRRDIVSALLANKSVRHELVQSLRETLASLLDTRTDGEMRQISTQATTFVINIQDEIRGLKKDIEFLDRIKTYLSEQELMECDLLQILSNIDFPSILAPFHPISPAAFYDELKQAESFLMHFVASVNDSTEKPLFITDWDGTMKDYCSQYATNVQPVFSAVMMGRFASQFTRTSAVLTAGPLRGPGILDLTALPTDEDGPVLFSGSWGREWWMHNKRVVHDDGVPDEGFVAIGRLDDEMNDLLTDKSFAQFALVGSGVQRKVDRITLGVQTVFGHVEKDLSSRYIDAVKERVHRVDPNNQILVFENASPLEVEVCAHSQGGVWNKGDGVAALVATLGDSVASGRVLVAGDTSSDLPMLRYVAAENKEQVMALFVGASESLRESVRAIVDDELRVCFPTCPDVVHAAFAKVLANEANRIKLN